MNIKDKKLIGRFVEKTKDITNLRCIVLFGSMARGEADKRSDIDVLLVIEEENPKLCIPEIMNIVTSLKPHREIKPVVTNLADYDEEFLWTVLREGKVLWGSMVVTPDKFLLSPYRLISYNLSKLKPSKKVKISRLIHGYQSKKIINGETKKYKYTGLKDKYNVHVISKNTVLIPERHAKNFLSELDKHGVEYQERIVWA
ncbi:MAG: nucleotidyltransferase domain-containing protein [Candidatus Thermoplasmatota archaeon]|nr:nucleotidyltransferase domain-containing protein [Candidatus Thermoplasmatota archaeon]